MKTPALRKRQRGSIVMVALCFTVILGIALASYLAVTNQAMKLSQRSYLKSVSKNLAEMGLEQALWAYNRNNWALAAWTIDAANHQATISFPITDYGNGIIGTVKVLVENYDAPNRSNTAWMPSNSYPPGTIVTYNGSSKWDAAISYKIKDLVSYLGINYRCTQANTAQTPVSPSSAYWIGTEDFIDFRSWYSYQPSSSTSSPVGQPPSNSPTIWNNITPIIYAQGVAIQSAGPSISTQLRGSVSVAPLFPNAIAATSTLTLSGSGASGTVNSYSSYPTSSTTADDYSTSISGFSAVLAGGNTSSTAVSVSKTVVQGYIAAPPSATAPYAPLFNYVGTVLKGPSGSAGIDNSRKSRSPYIPQFLPSIWYSSTTFGPNDVTRSGGKQYIYTGTWPSPSGDPASTSSWTASTPLPTIPTSIGFGSSIQLYYTTTNLSLPLASDILTINGPVILDVQGDLTIGSGKIVVTTTGSAEIHLSGQLTIDGSGGGLENQTKDPKKLLIVRGSSGSPLNGHTFNSIIPFYGTIYMPYSSLSIGPGVIVCGAVSANNVAFTAEANLHYDTSLLTTTYHSIDTLYVLTEWRELTDPADQVTFP